jgi:hypothetical protein
MTQEEEVRAAVLYFYQALEELFTGKGVDSMSKAWHHTPRVSSSHPFGPWSYGWDELWATWVECANLANPESKGSSINELKIQVYGDIAYSTGIFRTAPNFGSMAMSVTNILQKVDGVWKLIHHHADKTPALEAKLDEAAAQL